ncbi:MAG: virulence protein [Thermoleophilia bacterium]|nr:virulence protein [Thermoleophilia bacterium]
MTALGTTDAGTSIGARLAIDSLDHLVLTVADIDATLGFYVDVLGMREERFGEGRLALHFGDQKLNLHPAGSAIEPGAAAATPGSADLCLITRMPVEGVLRVLEDRGVAVEQGPVERTGATGTLLSVYVRDPDGNLVELANRLGD